jgi:hypothetical protein
MTVQAKFWVTNITHHALQAGNLDSHAATVELKPVYSDGANDGWSKHTPQGDLTMMVTNPAAIEQFELGAEYILTFDKAG